jgi:heme/copper-type cytochrome/quinol oxidase subunit 1
MNRKKTQKDNSVYFFEYFTKPSIYILIFGYFIGAIALLSIVSLPQWAEFIVVLGGGVLWTNLFWNKFIYAKFKKRDESTDSEGDGELK